MEDCINLLEKCALKVINKENNEIQLHKNKIQEQRQFAYKFLGQQFLEKLEYKGIEYKPMYFNNTYSVCFTYESQKDNSIRSSFVHFEIQTTMDEIRVMETIFARFDQNPSTNSQEDIVDYFIEEFPHLLDEFKEETT